MLQNDFYFVQSIDTAAGSVNALLALNASHRIFEGHFPGQPVVPGVCMMQIIKELLETAIQQSTRLVKADHLKFLSMIDPVARNMIRAELKYHIEENGEIPLTASLFHEDTVCFKCKALLRIG